MIKGKLEAKITVNVEVTDGLMAAFGWSPEMVKAMIEGGGLVKMMNETFGDEAFFKALGGCRVEQISAEVHEE